MGTTNIFDDPLLEPPHAADLLGVTVATLKWWRATGIGPVYLKLGARGSVRYRRSDLDRWLDANRHSPGDH